MKEKESITELIKKIHDILQPDSYKEFLENMMDPSYVKNMYEKNPKCFIKIQHGEGEEGPVFPICNVQGIHDPKVISFSLKLAIAISKLHKFSPVEVAKVIAYLVRKYNVYNQEIPKPQDMAYLKGRETMSLNKIREEMKEIK